jgi:ABC-type antimicrobial peptide transport system permease subunit
MGGTPLRMGSAVAAQALWTVVLATCVALLAALAVGAVIGALTPNVRVLIEAGSTARTAVGAAIVGLVAAALPLRRVLAVDPASAFRRTS